MRECRRINKYPSYSAKRGIGRFNICCACKKGANSGCPWSRGFIPVGGWDAEKVSLNWGENRFAETYKIHGCPLYDEDNRYTAQTWQERAEMIATDFSTYPGVRICRGGYSVFHNEKYIGRADTFIKAVRLKCFMEAKDEESRGD